MAAPNIVNVATINGKTGVSTVNTSATTIVTNSAASNKVFKVNALYISNIDGNLTADVSVDFFRNNTSFWIVRTLSVPADSTLDVISKSIYLEEGDSLRTIASASGNLHSVVSYEEIS